MNRALILALALAAAGCSKKSEEAPTAAAPEPAPVVDVESLPVEEQFEEEAEKDLTPQNLVAKLDEIEKEIGSQ
jgi:hypothetical protein